MKIKIMSDLHIDVNHQYLFPILDDKDVFTIICGDTSGDYNLTRNWIRENIRNGCFIIGNHYGYTDDSRTYQYICKSLKRSFPLKGKISFLQNSHKIIDDIVIVGATLWSDYKLGARNDDDVILNKQNAYRCMNDFRFDVYEYPDLIERRITPDILVDEHKKSLKYIDRICKKYPDKKIIVVTHHAPSNKSISNKYRDSDVNSCYASNLEDFIVSHNNIKLWCHGHVHEDVDYMIGECRVICNPRGYEYWDAPHKFDKNLIVEV